MLDVTNVEVEAQLGVDLADIYRKSDLYQRNKTLVNDLRVPAPGSNDVHFPTEFPLSFIQQLWCILWKQNLTYWRSPDYNLVRYGFSFFTALICGSIFWGVGQKFSKSSDLVITMGALYGSTLFICFNNAGTVQAMVNRPLQRKGSRDVLCNSVCIGTGIDRGSICAGASNLVWTHHILNATIPMDSGKILLVPLHIIYQLPHLHILPNDDGGHHSELHPGVHLQRFLLHALQPLHRLPDSTPRYSAMVDLVLLVLSLGMDHLRPCGVPIR